jgi:arginyl-tRNA synthetase
MTISFDQDEVLLFNSGYMTIVELRDTLTQIIPEAEWTLPPDVSKGILATNIAFVEAKKQGVNPADLAQKYVQKINAGLTTQGVGEFSCSAMGPFININPVWSHIESDNFRTSLEDTFTPNGKTLVQDMFHPNVGKKMHVGHIRSGNLGEAMRRISSLFYDNVISDNHLGDWGVQFSYTIWGIRHLSELNLDFDTIDLKGEKNQVLIEKFYQIYVQVNQLVEEDERVKSTARGYAKTLEKGLLNRIKNEGEQNEFEELFSLYEVIISISLEQFVEAEKFFRLNSWLPNRIQNLSNFDSILVKRIQDLPGVHRVADQKVDGQFDIILGESFFVPFVNEFEKLVEAELAVQEGEAIYIDLEEYKLGRCYLISSEGYSLYHSRDIVNRFVYAGLFGFDEAITYADLRQKHSFLQVFKVIELIIECKVFEGQGFGLLTVEEMAKASEMLSQKMAMFEGFGHFTLPEGAMSTRKGRIFEFSLLREMLETEVTATIAEKGFVEPDDETVESVAIAALKWADLHRDREQDVVFDPKQFLKFEGNTGVYQLYTVVRLKSILEKVGEVDTVELDFDLLNDEEKELLLRMYQLPVILETIVHSFKPHHLCTYLFEIAALINKWYEGNPVASLDDQDLKANKVAFIHHLIAKQTEALNLLGIETIDRL